MTQNQTLPFAGQTAMLSIYGCQQNTADGDKLRGMLLTMGFALTDDRSAADWLVLCTCAVREHAEKRLYGHLGGLSNIAKPGQRVVLCGCMAARPEVRAKLEKSFPQVVLTFPPADLAKFPDYMHHIQQNGGRFFADSPLTAPIDETLPTARAPIPGDCAACDGQGTGGLHTMQSPFARLASQGSTHSVSPFGGQSPPAGKTLESLPWASRLRRTNVTIMTGCDNFCTYCIVPHVRGRERSRPVDAVLAEVQDCIAQGYGEIWLLGQNVNSYAHGFPELLRRCGAFGGDYTIRFMTSHPKDASEPLFRAMAETPHIAPILHLPVQSGSDNVLRAMGRNYTRHDYLDKIALLRQFLPHVTLTSDIMVGFPGETEDDFEDTLDLVRTVRYQKLFTFIYSPRPPAPAAALPTLPKPIIQARFDRLLALQKQIENEV